MGLSAASGAGNDLVQAAGLAQLRAQITQVKAPVEGLAQQLGSHSYHSSQPPAADPPTRPNDRAAPPVGVDPADSLATRGTRALVLVEEVEGVIAVKPERCRRCQHRLAGEDGQPERHQVTELPPLQPVVTEYPLHQLGCRLSKR
jgi:transposase